MKRYLWLILIVFGFNLSFKAIADEVAQKTDGSFVGDNNESWGQEDVQQKTDTGFVGDNAIQAQNSYFAGDSYQQQVGNSTVAPFAGNDTFVGNDYGK